MKLSLDRKVSQQLEKLNLESWTDLNNYFTVSYRAALQRKLSLFHI